MNLRASVNQRAGVRRAVRAVALAAVLLAIGQGRARADRVDEAWRRGNEAYLHGDYAGGAWTAGSDTWLIVATKK